MVSGDIAASNGGGLLEAGKAPEDRLELAYTYQKIARIYKGMGLYKDAIGSYEKSLDIMLVSCPENAPEIGETYQGIGECCTCLGLHEEALSVFEIALAGQFLMQRPQPMHFSGSIVKVSRSLQTPAGHFLSTT